MYEFHILHAFKRITLFNPNTTILSLSTVRSALSHKRKLSFNKASKLKKRQFYANKRFSHISTDTNVSTNKKQNWKHKLVVKDGISSMRSVYSALGIFPKRRKTISAFNKIDKLQEKKDYYCNYFQYEDEVIKELKHVKNCPMAMLTLAAALVADQDYTPNSKHH